MRWWASVYTREKVRPAWSDGGREREIVRPAWSDGGRERDKVRPAHEKWAKIGVLWRAGRVFSRTGSRVILWGELCCAVALVAGPSTGIVNPLMRS